LEEEIRVNPPRALADTASKAQAKEVACPVSRSVHGECEAWGLVGKNPQLFQQTEEGIGLLRQRRGRVDGHSYSDGRTPTLGKPRHALADQADLEEIRTRRGGRYDRSPELIGLAGEDREAERNSAFSRRKGLIALVPPPPQPDHAFVALALR